jgi:hypothetical protein
MSTFKNVSKVDREVQVDGRTIDAPAGGTFAVADEFDSTLVQQPHFEKTKPTSKVAEQGDN